MHGSDCQVRCAGAESKAGSGENEDEGWTRQGRGKKSQAVTRGQSSVQVCPREPGAGMACVVSRASGPQGLEAGLCHVHVCTAWLLQLTCRLQHGLILCVGRLLFVPGLLAIGFLRLAVLSVVSQHAPCSPSALDFYNAVIIPFKALRRLCLLPVSGQRDTVPYMPHMQPSPLPPTTGLASCQRRVQSADNYRAPHQQPNFDMAAAMSESGHQHGISHADTLPCAQGGEPQQPDFDMAPAMLTRSCLIQGGETLASAMLGGALRSDVRAQGARTSATIQPFTHLQLDIYSRDVFSISDAFTFLTTSEHLERECLADYRVYGLAFMI